MAVSVVIVGEETRIQHSEQAGLDPLAERLADGDSRAARVLVERHYTRLYRYAFAMLRGEQEAVEDAVQVAFEGALRVLGMYPEERIRAMAPGCTRGGSNPKTATLSPVWARRRPPDSGPMVCRPIVAAA